MDVEWAIDAIKFGIPTCISLYALWQTLRGPSIVFIRKDYDAFYEVKAPLKAGDPLGVKSISEAIISREEAYFDFSLVFLNRGTKGGTIINLSLIPSNVKLGEIKDTLDYLEFEPYFRDSQGKDLPKSAVYNIHGNESIGIPVGCVLRLWGKEKREMPKGHIEDILREQNNVLQFKLSYEKTKYKSRYLGLIGKEAFLEKRREAEFKVSLNKK